MQTWEQSVPRTKQALIYQLVAKCVKLKSVASNFESESNLDHAKL